MRWKDGGGRDAGHLRGPLSSGPPVGREGCEMAAPSLPGQVDVPEAERGARRSLLRRRLPQTDLQALRRLCCKGCRFRLLRGSPTVTIRWSQADEPYLEGSGKESLLPGVLPPWGPFPDQREPAAAGQPSRQSRRPTSRLHCSGPPRTQGPPPWEAATNVNQPRLAGGWKREEEALGNLT